MSTTATRLLNNYIGGGWTAAASATAALDVTHPATGEVLPPQRTKLTPAPRR